MPEDEVRPEPPGPDPVAGESQEALIARDAAASEARQEERVAAVAKIRERIDAREAGEEPEDEPEEQEAPTAEAEDEIPAPEDKPDTPKQPKAEDKPDEADAGFPEMLLDEAKAAGWTPEDIAGYEDPADLHRALAREDKRFLKQWGQHMQRQAGGEEPPPKPAPKAEPKPEPSQAPDLAKLDTALAKVAEEAEDIGAPALTEALNAIGQSVKALHQDRADAQQRETAQATDAQEALLTERITEFEEAIGTLPEAFHKALGVGSIDGDGVTKAQSDARSDVWKTMHALKGLHGDNITWATARAKALRIEQTDLVAEAAIDKEKDALRAKLKGRKGLIIGKPAGKKPPAKPGSPEGRLGKVRTWREKIESR